MVSRRSVIGLKSAITVKVRIIKLLGEANLKKIKTYRSSSMYIFNYMIYIIERFLQYN